MIYLRVFKSVRCLGYDYVASYLLYTLTYNAFVGRSELEAMNFLEKKVDELNGLDANSTIELAISAMQYILSTDFKSSEIEVGIVTMGSKFRVLAEEEIEERLNAISEKSDS